MWHILMSKKKFAFLAVALLGTLALIALYHFADPISPDNTGTAYQIEQAVKAVIVALLAWLSVRFVDLFYWQPLERRRGRPVSRLLQDIVLLAILAVAALFILMGIYGKSISGVGGLLYMGLGGFGYIAKDILADYISGLVLDFADNYKEGDWIRLANGTVAQVVDIKLRETTLKLANDTIIHINNSDMLKGNIINYNDSENGYWGEVVVTLDRSIPVARAKRLLQAAAAAAPQVAQKQAKVLAREATDGGVIYRVMFKIPEFAQTITVQHNVIQSLMSHLIDHNLNISAPSTYVYNWNEELDEPSTIAMTPAYEALRLSPLFAECSKSDLQKIARVVRMRKYAPGEIIIAEKTRGTTMYFLAEGVVEISIQVKVADEDQEGAEVLTKKHITFLTTNDFFGEGGVLYDSPRNATCSAYTETVLYELGRNDLKKVLKELPDVVVKISEAMVARRQETSDIASKAEHSLKERKKLTDEFAAALRSFLGL